MDTGIARVALVPGTSQGIGEAIARASHRKGAKVALLARDAYKLAKIVGELGDGALAVGGDVTDATSLERAVEAVERGLGPVDVLVNDELRPQDVGRRHLPPVRGRPRHRLARHPRAERPVGRAALAPARA